MDGCKNYTVLSEAERAQGNAVKNVSTCGDFNLTTGWYRFQGAAGSRIAENCVAKRRCDSKAQGWLNGTHPTVAEGVVNRKVCYHRSTNCCRDSNTIKVKNCSSYYVYELQKTPGCFYRYCGNGGSGKLA